MRLKLKFLFFVLFIALAISIVRGFQFDNEIQPTAIDNKSSAKDMQKIIFTEGIDNKVSGKQIAAVMPDGDLYTQLRQTGDYYALALDLLPKAQSGDGISQYHLGLILLMCEGYTFFGERLKQDNLLYQANGIGKNDEQFMDVLLTQYEKCDSFVGSDLGAFYDSPEPLDDVARKIYWFVQAYKNGILDAAPMVLQGFIATGEFNNLSVKEQINLANSLIKNIENQSPSSLIWLSSVSELDSAFIVYHAVSIDDFNLDPEIPILNYLDNWFEWCMKFSHENGNLSDDDTCGKDMMRYGAPLAESHRANIIGLENDVQRVREALASKDYRAAGLNMIIDILEQKME